MSVNRLAFTRETERRLARLDEQIATLQKRRALLLAAKQTNTVICDLRSRGWTLRDIADLFEVSVQQIHEVIHERSIDRA